MSKFKVGDKVRRISNGIETVVIEVIGDNIFRLKEPGFTCCNMFYAGELELIEE